MITIKTSELSNFFKRAGSIKSNEILPIYSYLKFECDKTDCKVYKSNGHSFIIHNIEVSSKEKRSFLIEEKKIKTLVDRTSAKEITIEIKTSKASDVDDVILSDGLNKIKCQSYDAGKFASIPDSEKSEQMLLSASVVESLFLSKSVAKIRKDIKTWMCYVYIVNTGKKSSYIFGMDDGTMYYKKFDLPLPTLALELETCSTLGGYAEMNYSKKDNYHFFDIGNTIFGFIDCEAKSADISKILDSVDKKVNFVVNRKEMIEFCEICMSINPGILKPVVSITDDGKNKLFLKYENAESATSNERVFDVKKVGKPDDFIFLAEQMVSVLKNLPYETVQFNGPIKHNYFITTEEDENFLAGLREVVFDTMPAAATA